MTTFQKLIIMIFAVSLVSFSGCKKDNFDEPPTETVDPNLPVTHTISEFKALFLGTTLQLTDDITIAGIIVANDKSGNIFNQIIIDDGTAGISVAIDQNELNGEFPVGRKIYVNCKSLYLAADNSLIGLYGAIDITGSPIEIPASLISKYIVKANAGNPVVPIEVADIDNLNNTFQNRLVKLSNVEFDEADANQPFADAVNKQSVSRILKECDGDNLEVRSSGYADFATKLTPKGKGTIIGVYTVYGTDKQLILRDGAETDMNNIKCDGSDPNAVVILEEKFGTVTDFVDIAVNGWSTFKSAGTKNWVGRIGGTVSNPYAQMSAFGSPNEASNISWLISPVLNLNATTDEKLSFSSYAGFHSTPAVLEILYSTNYSGTGDPSLATWTNLSAIFSATNSWISSGVISLNSISSSTFYFAFKYTGGYTPTVATTQFRVDNIKITGI